MMSLSQGSAENPDGPTPDRQGQLLLLAVGCSLLFSLFSILTHPVPNLDAYTYLRTAEIFLQDGLAAAFNFYPWASYAVLAGSLHALTGLDLLLAARCLNALFFALLVYAFIGVAREINSSRRFVLLSALTVLLYPQLNEYRADVIRDIAYLAFSLLALRELIRLNRTQAIRHAGLFTAACLAATLFRPEAMAFLLLAPLALLFSAAPLRQRLRGPLLILGSALLLALLGVILAGASVRWTAIIADGFMVYRPFLAQALSLFTGGDPALAAALFHEHAAQYSGQYITLFLLTGLLSILFVKLFTGLGWIYFGTLAYGAWTRRIAVPRHALLPLLGYLLVALLILLGFVMVTRFLTSRYTMLFSLVLVLLVPVIVARLLDTLDTSSRKVKWGLALVLLYLFVDSFISFGESKRYHVAAVEWLQEHVPVEEALSSTNPYIAYRLALTPHYDRLSTSAAALIEESAPGDYLVLDLEDDSINVIRAETGNRALSLLVQFPANEPRLGIYLRQ